jgi:DNA polymerase III subunit epsilon
LKSLNETTFVCFDCESTGLDEINDQVIEIGVATFTLNGTIETYETLVHPGRTIPEKSTEIHHINDAMVKGKPRFKQVLPRVIELIGTYPIVGHGVNFDINLVSHGAQREGISCQIGKNITLDTLRLARHYGQCSVNSLEKLREHFNIPEEGAHRAMNDVIVNIQVFKHLIAKYKTLEQLTQILKKPIELKVIPLGKYKGRLVKEVPTDYLRWAAQIDFDLDLSFTIKQELKRRKKGLSFNQAANPFHNL